MPDLSPIPNTTEKKTANATDKVQARVEQTANAVRDAAGETAQRAQSVVDAGRHAVEHAAEQGRELLERGNEAAVEAYDHARAYASDAARNASETLRDAGQQTAGYVRRASIATGSFVSTHALPLTAVGLGLGWLALSVARSGNRRRVPEVSYSVAPRRHALRETYEPRTRGELLTTAPTTTGDRLIGVRATRTDY